MASCLTFRSLIHFWAYFCIWSEKCSSFILLHVAVQFSQHHSLKILFFPIVYSCLLYHRLTTGVWVHRQQGFISGLHFVPLIFIPVLCQYYTILIIVLLLYNLKSGYVILLALIFFLKFTLALQGPLCVHSCFRIICFSSVKKCPQYFDRNCVKSVDCLREYGLFFLIERVWKIL